MSYDLVVFHAAATPEDRAGFSAWYQEQREAPPREARPALRAWCREMEERGGPFHVQATRDAVCASFSRHESTEIFETAFDLAGHHEVGLYDPQSGKRWLPSGGRRLAQWSEDQARGGPAADAVAVASTLLEAMSKSGALEPDVEGDWDDLSRQVAAVLDRARRRSPITDLWKLFMSHDAVGELYLDKAQLKQELDLASEQVLGHPPFSETGWV